MTVGAENEAGNAGPLPMIVSRIMAAADSGEWERRRSLPKRMGELSEAAFLHKASSLGFGIAKPWGDSERYDFIVWGQAGRMWRVVSVGTLRLGLTIGPRPHRMPPSCSPLRTGSPAENVVLQTPISSL